MPSSPRFPAFELDEHPDTELTKTSTWHLFPSVPRYVLRATSHPLQETTLRVAIITVQEDGVTVVSFGGEPLFAFTSLEECLSAYAISRDDLERIFEP